MLTLCSCFLILVLFCWWNSMIVFCEPIEIVSFLSFSYVYRTTELEPADVRMAVL
jgi:hypothetical protein